MEGKRVAILVFMEAGLLQWSEYIPHRNVQIVAILVFMEAGLLREPQKYSRIGNWRRNPSFHGSGFTTISINRYSTGSIKVAILVFMEAGLLLFEMRFWKHLITCSRNPSFHGSGFTTIKCADLLFTFASVAILVFMEAGLLPRKKINHAKMELLSQS